MNSSSESLSKKERRELKRQEKRAGRQQLSRKRKVKEVFIAFVVTAFVAGGIAAFVVYVKQRPTVPEGDVVSQSGLHWHPKLTITIKGKDQEVPANIGLGVVESPIHTHDATGTIHMEMIGVVTKEDTKLGKFFQVWGKQFSANCIFDFCNGSDGKVKMFVNGTENTEFENYLMKDGDKIEIQYE